MNIYQVIQKLPDELVIEYLQEIIDYSLRLNKDNTLAGKKIKNYFDLREHSESNYLLNHTMEWVNTNRGPIFWSDISFDFYHNRQISKETLEKYNLKL